MILPVYTYKINAADWRQPLITKVEGRRLEFGASKSPDMLPLEWVIGGLGLFINVVYHGYKYANTGYLLEHIRGDPMGYAIVFSTIPLFALIGYLYRSERRHQRELEEFEKLTALFMDLLRSDFAASLKLLKEGTRWLEEGESKDERGRLLELMKKEMDGLEEAMGNASKLVELLSGPGVFTYMELGNSLEGVVKEMKVTAEKRGIEVQCEFKRTYMTWCSPDVKVVVAHLLSNAIKYSPENSRVLLDVEDAGWDWRIAVKDSGEGVPDRYKESIFERFDGEKDGIIGLGLGLAIVKKLVDSHDSRVWVEDNKPRGSIFYVSLPKWRK